MVSRNRTNRMLGIALLGAIPSSSCTSYAKSTNIVSFQGEITTQSAQYLVDYFKSHKDADTLNIMSPGGQADAGIYLGKFLIKHNIHIKVDRFCFSACANYVFLPASNRELSPQSLVGFHTNPTLIAELLKRSPVAANQILFKDMQYAESRLYRAAGINPDFAYTAEPGLVPVCVEINDNMSSSDRNRVALATKFSTYVPSEELLRTFGVKGSLGAWPKDSTDVALRLRSLPFNTRFQVRFLSYFVKSQSKIPLC